MMHLTQEGEVRRVVWDIVHRTPVFDVHTHLFDSRFGNLCLWGIDELLTYHYLVAEVMRVGVNNQDKLYAPAEFLALPKNRQAELIWRRLFIENSPLSEATRGVLTSLGLMRSDPSQRSLDRVREFFADQSYENHTNLVLGAANVSAVVMTNDPFEDAERKIWETQQNSSDPRFLAALRLDVLLNKWNDAAPRLRAWGYPVAPDGSPEDADTILQTRKFLHRWIDIMHPWYMAVSLPPDFDAFDHSPRSRLLRRAVLPVALERNLPVALMIGVNKFSNPELQLAGDSVGKASINVIERLCREYPSNKFLVTMLARENQHELCVAARKFRNLMIFGCWWFLNIPQEIEEISRLRLELLGLSFIPQHSDARVLDQLTYKWAHSRWILGRILGDKYSDLVRTGWLLSTEEIERDIQALFSGNFHRFCEAKF